MVNLLIFAYSLGYLRYINNKSFVKSDINKF